MHREQSLVLLLNCCPELEVMCCPELEVVCSTEMVVNDGRRFAEHYRPDSSTEPERLQTTASFLENGSAR